MGQKGDLSVFKCGMVVGGRQAYVKVTETADLNGLSHKTID